MAKRSLIHVCACAHCCDFMLSFSVLRSCLSDLWACVRSNDGKLLPWLLFPQKTHEPLNAVENIVMGCIRTSQVVTCSSYICSTELKGKCSKSTSYCYTRKLVNKAHYCPRKRNICLVGRFFELWGKLKPFFFFFIFVLNSGDRFWDHLTIIAPSLLGRHKATEDLNSMLHSCLVDIDKQL